MCLNVSRIKSEISGNVKLWSSMGDSFWQQNYFYVEYVLAGIGEDDKKECRDRKVAQFFYSKKIVTDWCKRVSEI